MALVNAPRAGNTPPLSAPASSPRRPRRPAPAWAKLVTIVVTLALVFAIAEAALRIAGVRPMTATALSAYFRFDRHTGWRGAPGVSMVYEKVDFQVLTTHGPDGFRLIHRALPPAESDAARSGEVWVLGDSGTWGWGVEDGQTYVDRLNEANSELTHRNLGQCGYSALQEYVLLRDLLEAEPGRRPRRVLVLFDPNDLYENMDGRDQNPPRPYIALEQGEPVVRNYPVTGGTGFRLNSWLKRHSMAYNYLYFYIKRAKRALQNRASTGRADTPPLPPDEQWGVLRFVYGKMQDLCDDHGIDLVAISMPAAEIRLGAASHDGIYAYDDAMRRRFVQTCADVGVRVVDIRPTVRDYFRRADADDASPRLTFPNDPHFTVDGHRVIARGIMAAEGRAGLTLD